MDRRYLFLQGPLSSFYSEIGRCLQDNDQSILKINICGNDVIDWRLKPVINYKGRPDEWEGFLETILVEQGITDIILHGDRRYYHKVAIQLARKLNIQVTATELGYLRPDWITVEKEACSTGSHFPDDPEVIKNIAHEVGTCDRKPRFINSSLSIIIQELRFTLFNLLMWPVFPHYLNHRPEGRIRFYTSWLLSKLTKSSRVKKSTTLLRDIMSSDSPFYIFALQLGGDFQLRDHSPFKSTSDGIEYILQSFAVHAPKESRLVIKIHPLEVHHRSLRRSINRITNHYDLKDRLLIVDAGNLKSLASKASGFVTINSSAGMEALESNCPSCTIMPTIYDVKGLTFQQQLDDFWQHGSAPDSELYNALYDALAGTIQVRGTLYDPEGLRAAATAVADKLLTNSVNPHGAYVPVPPRMEKASKMGVLYQD